jgi:hypothetical protein
MLDIIIDITLILASLALLFIPLIWNIIDRENPNKKYLCKITPAGWVFLAFFVASIVLGIIKAVRDDKSNKDLKKEVDSISKIDSLLLLKISAYRNYVYIIKIELGKRHLVLDSASGKIKMDPIEATKELVKVERLKAIDDSTQATEKVLQEKAKIQQNQNRIDSLEYWQKELKATKDTVKKDSSRLGYVKAFHIDKFRWPADKTQQIYDANKKLDKDKGYQQHCIDKINKYKY